jgi:hypothetical protein
MPSPFNINTCPKCGGTHIAVEVRSWADFEAGEPDHFDDEDIPTVEPITGGNAICRNQECVQTWIIEAADSASSKEEG